MILNYSPAVAPGSFRAPFQKLADDPAAKALRRLAAAYILNIADKIEGAAEPVRAEAIADAIADATANPPARYVAGR